MEGVSVKYFSLPNYKFTSPQKNYKFTSKSETIQDLVTWLPITWGQLLKMEVLHNERLKDKRKVEKTLYFCYYMIIENQSCFTNES
jgi:hypothetical protein